MVVVKGLQYLAFGKAVNWIFQIQKLNMRQPFSHFSGSCLPSKLNVHVDLIDEDKDLTEKTNSHKQWEPSPALQLQIWK